MSDVGQGPPEMPDPPPEAQGADAADAAENPSPVPRAPASDDPGGAAIPAGSGLPENVAGALAYLLGPITGVIFFLIDRERTFVRFHAVQCIALCIAGIALSIVLTVLTTILAFIPVLGWLIGLLLSVGLGLGGFALWIWLMLQAYKGNDWALPGLEPHIRRLTAETGEAAPGA